MTASNFKTAFYVILCVITTGFRVSGRRRVHRLSGWRYREARPLCSGV